MFKGIHYLAIATLVLVTVTIFSVMQLPFGFIFYLTICGQIVLIISVIKVLKDDYHTDKTFNDFYEDRSDLGK